MGVLGGIDTDTVHSKRALLEANAVGVRVTTERHAAVAGRRYKIGISPASGP